MDRGRDARRETHYTPESLRQWRLARQQRLQSQARVVNVATSFDENRHTESDANYVRVDTSYRHSPYAHAAAHRRAVDHENTRLDNFVEQQRPSHQVLDSASVSKSPGSLLLPSLMVASAFSYFSDEVEQSPMPSSAALSPAPFANLATPSEQQDTSETETPSEATTDEQVTSCRVSWCAAPAKRYGLCWTHGGEKRCCRSGCARAATAGSEFCELHELQQRR